jgi:hypothetical protein
MYGLKSFVDGPVEEQDSWESLSLFLMDLLGNKIAGESWMTLP